MALASVKLRFMDFVMFVASRHIDILFLKWSTFVDTDVRTYAVRAIMALTQEGIGIVYIKKNC